MKLYRFEKAATIRIGVQREDRLVDLSDLVPQDMKTVIRDSASTLQAIQRALDSRGPATYGFDEVRLLTPIAQPGKVLCSGINYHGHFAENPNAVMPSSPFFFAKLPNAIVGPGDPIIKPAATQQLDYEVEFAVVLGKSLRRPTPEAAFDAVFGYTILHDVSARDVQFKDNQITLGKNFDTFAPIGPCIVTKDEIADPANVRLSARVNGRTLQDGSTTDWVFPLPKLLAALGTVMALEPGDIVTTGTPAGVGYFQKPQVFLNPGDVVTLEVEGIGTLTNPVIAEE
jgi:2-keto-4-pentenoate hydratase/2-oxohepta-3-ene-1,7-dioic acid hydratase in catechol pathway